MKLVFHLKKKFNIKFHRRSNESKLTHCSYHSLPFFHILMVHDAVCSNYHDFKQNFYNLENMEVKNSKKKEYVSISIKFEKNNTWKILVFTKYQKQSICSKNYEKLFKGNLDLKFGNLHSTDQNEINLRYQLLAK